MKDYSHRMVVVYWNDSVQHSDGSVSPKHHAHLLVRIGWLLQYDDDGISVASEYSEDEDSWRDEHFIPGPMIVKVDEIDL